MPLIALAGPALGALGGAGGLISAGAGLAGGLIGAHGAGAAADAQVRASQQAGSAISSMFDRTRSDLAPFLTTGTSALSQLAQIFGINSGGPSAQGAEAAMSALTKYPGYQFGFEQGGAALDRSAASHGMALSGAQLVDSRKFGNDYAIQQAFAPYISQLNTMATMGQQAGTDIGRFGSHAADGIAESYMAGGQARAGGKVAQSNAYGGMLSGLMNGSGAFPGLGSALSSVYGGGGGISPDLRSVMP